MYQRESHRKTYHFSFLEIKPYTYLYIFIVFIVLIELKLFYIQIIDSKKYEKLANSQHWYEQTLPASRGNIYSSDGYTLAGVEYNYLMYGEPNKIKDKESTSVKLAKLMSEIKTNPSLFNSNKMEEVPSDKDAAFFHYYNKYLPLLSKDLMWISLEKIISPLEKEEIEKSGIEGIGFEEIPSRYYPENMLCSHVLGFVAQNDKGEKQGYYGIEGKFNEDLKGRPGRIIQEKDALGNPILAGGYRKDDSLSGRDVYLTVNRTVQYLVEKKLKSGVEKYGAVSGTVIVMDPFTGEVISMSNFPTYSPGDFTVSEDSKDPSADYRKLIEKRNLAISQTYEPGSVIKPLTVAVGIDLGLMNPQTTFEDNGPVTYYEYKIDNWDGKHHGTQNLVQLLQKSNNIGAAWVGHQIGSKKLHDYFADFGLGTKSGIALEGEDSGILREVSTWADIDLANISFGQGMSATPLQVLNAFNVLVNGGYLMEPKIISKVVDKERNISLEIPKTLLRRVIKQETSNTLIDMLEQAASGGEAKYFVFKNYRVAGKTGTAQIPVDGKYDPQKTNTTFIGYLPGSKKFTMLVKLEEPHSSIYAAETAVPLWMDIASELIKYYGIPADKSVDTNITQVSTNSNTNM